MTKRRRWIKALSLTALALTPTACDSRLGKAVAPVAIAGPVQPTNVDIGSPLFTPADAPKITRPPSTGVDPIVVTGAQVTVPYTQNVPTKNDGTLWQICTEWKPGDPDTELFISPSDPNKKYRRLSEGETVVPNQLVGLLDDRVARAKYNAAKTEREAADKSLSAAGIMLDATKRSFDLLSKPNIASILEKNKAEVEYFSAVKGQADSAGGRDTKVEAEKVALVQLEEHELRATIGGKIKIIFSKPGEAVKAQTPVLQIQNTDTLRVEGLLPIQNLPLMRNARGKTVTIEPSTQLAPVQELAGHWAPVTGVAVSNDKSKPLIVTVCEDKRIRIWDRSTKLIKVAYALEVPVRAVACTGQKAAGNLAIVGSDDGVARIIDLSQSTSESIRKLDGATHRGRINSVAFSPDGSYAASADDKQVFIWDVGTGKVKYMINAEHRGPITSVQFTPQAKLVTTARDRSIRVWDLGEKAAKVSTVIDSRAGTVDVLGISSDGQRIIFDQERSLHVRGLTDERTDAVINAASESSQFTSFALFSPNNDLVLAAGTADSPLGLWKLSPNSTRSYQRVRLALSGSTPTCAAFDPGNSFVVVGTSDHRVLVFARPEKSDLDKVYEARIVFVDESLDSTDRKVKIWAMMTNTGGPVLPGETVTMVLPLGQ